MKKHYILIRKMINGTIPFNVDDSKDMKNLKKAVTAVGILTVIGAGLLSLTGCGKTSTEEYIPPKHSFEHEIEQEIQESLIDFENYDSNSLNNFCQNISSLYDSDDAIVYRNKYEEIVNEKASKWGVDPNLAMAILTQESRSGKTTNLMQIGFNVWQGESFKVYDFENDKYVDILLTEDPVLYSSDRYLTINKKDLENPSTNISIGCAMLQKSMACMNYDIPAGIQCYNYGPTSMNNKVFSKTYESLFQSREDILKDQYNFSFMNYTDAYEYGDNDYFYHVSRFLNPLKDTITIKEKDEYGVTVIHNFEYQKLIDEFKEYQSQIL